MAKNILHIINKSPQNFNLTQCLTFSRQGDALLFIENGVYQLNSLQAFDIDVFGLDVDIQARGLQHTLPQQITVIDYPDFVNLSTHYEVSQQW